MGQQRVFVEKDVAALPLFSFRKRGIPDHVVLDLGNSQRLEVAYRRGPLSGFDFRVFHQVLAYASRTNFAESFNRSVEFLLYDLACDLGYQEKNINGKLYLRLHEAFLRLFSTQIRLSGKKVWYDGAFVIKNETFSLLSRITERLPVADGLPRAKYRVEISSVIADNIRHRYFFYYDKSTFAALDSDIAKAFYVKLQSGLRASAVKGVFRKRYHDICNGWLQITPHDTCSEAKRQLCALDELVKAGVISTWDLRKSNGELILELMHGRRIATTEKDDLVNVKPSAPILYDRVCESYPDLVAECELTAIGTPGSMLWKADVTRRVMKLLNRDPKDEL